MTEGEQANMLDFIRRLQKERGEQESVATLRTPTTLKNSLLDQMKAYELPWGSVSDYLEYQRLETSKLRRIITEKKNDYAARGWAFNDTTLEDLKEDKKPLCEDKDITKGWNYAKRTWFEKPIVYQKEVELSKFQSEIEFFGDSSLISLPGTLKKLLEAAQKKGLDFPLLSQLLFLFIQKYFTELLSAAYQYRSDDDAYKLFSLLVERIDLEEEKAKINKAKKTICRNVDDHISEVMNKVKSLACQLLLITSPQLPLEKRQHRAGAMALMDMESFVSEKCWKKYKDFTSQRMSNGQFTDFTTAIRHIAKLESDKDLKITSTMCSKTNFDATLALNASDETVGISNVSTYKGGDRKSRDPRKRTGDHKYRGKGGFRGGSNSSAGRSSGSSRGSFTSSRDSSRGSRNSNSSFGGRNNSSDSQQKQKLSDKSYSKSSYRRFDKEASPQSFKRDQLIDVKKVDGHCYRCYGKHMARDCPRYFQTSKYYCGICAKKQNLKLYHSEQYCRFSKKSQYRTPSPGTKERRFNRDKSGYKDTTKKHLNF